VEEGAYGFDDSGIFAALTLGHGHDEILVIVVDRRDGLYEILERYQYHGFNKRAVFVGC